ncbi:beta strand repeat-containing protein [Nocardioides coralli]|uniref:beta strand repeat-containing protein n=1 Tax=Nocardioides coralli TaxID=2872154 RepID=UPI001CA3EDC2|nr:DUF11 domain-containing protein [Nocardioides coralli]QZY28801.1 DUF11 domain-containing protein [Nocardioides coralli]
MSHHPRTVHPRQTTPWRRRGSLLLAAALTAAGLAVVDAVALPAPKAWALPALECPNVYSLQGQAPRNLWEVDVDTGTQSSVGSEFDIAGNTNNLNGLGIAGDGSHAIGVIPTTGSGRAVYRYDRATDTTAQLGAGVANAATTHGAIDPISGIYYYGGLSGSTLNVYGFNPATATSLGLVATGTIPNNGANGDFAFDRRGRLYVVAGNAGSSVFSRVDQPMPATGPAITITATKISDIPAPQAINGIAYSGTGYLYVSSGANIYQINPSSGAVVSTNAFSQTGSVDLGSCATPSTVSVVGSFPDGRSAPGHQVTLTVTGGGISQGNTATTTGTDPGPQTEPGEVVGPIPGLPDTTYTVSQSGSGTGSGYTSTWRCVDENAGDTVVASGTGSTGTFTMPWGGHEGAAVVCTFTNALSAPAVALDKQAGTLVDADNDGRPSPGDTVDYTFVVTNTGNVDLAAVSVSDPLVGTVTCPAGTLAPTASVTCTAAAYAVTQADIDTGRVDNTATATGQPADSSLADVTSAPDATSTPLPKRPRLLLDKVAGTPQDDNASGKADAGDSISYTFDVTNTGNVTLHAVAVDDPKLGAVTCTDTVLAPGASTSCTASPHTITVAEENAGSVDNTATARALDPDDEPVTSEPDSTSTPVQTANPELTLDKAAGTPVDVNGNGLTDAGDTIAYTFTVTNTGDVPVSGISVGDPRLTGVTCAETALAPTASTSCTADPYTVTTDDELAGSVDNTAVASGRDPDSADVVSAPDSTSTPVTAADPSLTVDKVAGTPVDVNGSGITDAGDTIAYTFTVTNTGNVTLSGVGVDDALAGPVTCDATTLAPGADTACAADAAYVITADDETAGVVTNTATASGTPAGDSSAVTSGPDTTNTPVTAQAPALTLDKVAGTPVDVNGSGLTDAGDTIAYSFTVTNDGNVPVRDVRVVDPLVGAVTCDAVRLAPTESTSCTADAAYVVTEADESAGSVDNTAVARGDDPDGDRVDSPEDTTSTPTDVPAPSLALVKTAGAPVDTNGSGLTDAGDTIAYSFTVTNDGNVPVTDLRVVDPLAGAVTCDVTSLAPAASAHCTADAAYVVTEADETAGSVDNTAVARGDDPDGVRVDSPEDTTSTPTAVPAPSLAFEKTAGTPVDVNGSGLTDAGDTIAYSFTVTNDGNVPVSGLTVVDALAGPVTCDVTTLAPAEATDCVADAPYEVTGADETAGSVDNTAHAQATDPDGGDVTSPEDSTTTPTAVPAPSLLLEKTAGTPVDVNGSGLTDAGDTIAYSFTVTNDGNVPVTGIAVVDPKAGAVTCADTSLAPSASTSCTADAAYVVTEADELAGEVVNEARAEGVDPDGADVLSPEDSTTTPTDVPAPALLLDKTAGEPVDVNGSGITDAGDTIAYTFTVTNDGNVPVSAVAVDDPRAGSVTCDDTTLAPGASTACAADAAYVVTDDDVAAEVVTNTATAHGTDPDGGPVASDPDSTNTPVTAQAPVLTLEKHAADPADANRDGIVDAGDTIAYTFTVTNDGNVPVAGIAVDDPLVGAVTCAPVRLLPGESADCAADAAYEITRADERDGKVVNVAVATGTDPDGGDVLSNDDSTSTPVDTPQASLALDKRAGEPVDRDDNGRVDAGDTILYTFTVTNTGNVIARDVRVRDPKLAKVRCATTTLEPGQSTLCRATEPYVITKAEVREGSVDNTAYARADVLGSWLSSPDDSVTTPTAVAGGGAAEPPALPETGGPSRLVAGAGLGLLALGSLLLVAGRRRREQTG